jgi:hypothetical protein
LRRVEGDAIAAAATLSSRAIVVASLLDSTLLELHRVLLYLLHLLAESIESR